MGCRVSSGVVLSGIRCCLCGTAIFRNVQGPPSYLSDNNPRAWTPGAGKEKDVDADERDHSADSVAILSVGDANNGDDELANNHSEGTPQKERTATNTFDGPKCDWGREHVDNSGNHADEEGVADGSEGFEEGCAKVEDEVDAGPPREVWLDRY